MSAQVLADLIAEQTRDDLSRKVRLPWSGGQGWSSQPGTESDIFGGAGDPLDRIGDPRARPALDILIEVEGIEARDHAEASAKPVGRSDMASLVKIRQPPPMLYGLGLIWDEALIRWAPNVGPCPGCADHPGRRGVCLICSRVEPSDRAHPLIGTPAPGARKRAKAKAKGEEPPLTRKARRQARKGKPGNHKPRVVMADLWPADGVELAGGVGQARPLVAGL